MSVVLLIVMLVVWEASAAAPPSLLGWPAGGMAFAVGYGVLLGLARLWGKRFGNGDDDYDRFGKQVDRFNRGMAVARALVPIWFAVGALALGWHRAVDDSVRGVLGPTWDGLLATPGTVIGLLPGLVAWAALWWAQYPVDRAVRERGAMVQLEDDLPVFALPPFGSYMVNRLRVQLLFTTVPVVMILAARDGAAVALRRVGPLSDAAESVVSVGTTLLILLVAPVVLRRVLRTRPLPPGRLRDGLAEVLSLAGVRCRAVLLWDTHFNLGNAAVMGLLPPVRYVLFSDLLLESMTDEQLQAVFAHELGHVRHRHLAWLIAVLGTGMAAMSVAGTWAAGRLASSESADVAVLVASAVVAWVSYGALSRWFERQADVYAVRLMDRTAGGQGAAAFAGALRRVSVVNHVPLTARNWTHGSLAARLAYLDRLTADPAVAAAFDRRGRRLRAALLASIVLCGTIAAVGLR